jgi:hypothetical protein
MWAFLGGQTGLADPPIKKYFEIKMYFISISGKPCNFTRKK